MADIFNTKILLGYAGLIQSENRKTLNLLPVKEYSLLEVLGLRSS